MKKYGKLTWFAVFVLLVFFYWEDMLRGFRDGYNSLP